MRTRLVREGGRRHPGGYTTIPRRSPRPARLARLVQPITLPIEGDWNVTAVALDTAGQYDFVSTGATARYLAYPGDTPPAFKLDLLAPTEGTTFTNGKIFVSGRAEDDQAMAKVEVAIVNSAGQYMSSSGTFTSTRESWRTAFLTSPGTPGSNFSYTTPDRPAGAYTVKVRGIDQHDLVTTDPPARSVTVHAPGEQPSRWPNHRPGRVQPPNVCQFDGKDSTDENAPR